MRLLRTSKKATEEEIKLVINWLRHAYPLGKDDKYFPVIRSAQSFKEKFFEKLLPRAIRDNGNTAEKPAKGLEDFRFATPEDFKVLNKSLKGACSFLYFFPWELGFGADNDSCERWKNSDPKELKWLADEFNRQLKKEENVDKFKKTFSLDNPSRDPDFDFSAVGHFRKGR